MFDKIRRYGGKVKKAAAYVSNGHDLVAAGKIGLAGGVAYYANRLLKDTEKKIKDYTPGKVIKKVVTHTEKGIYNLDRTLEREIEKIPGGKTVLDANKGVVNYFWDLVAPGLRGSPEMPRTQKFYERTEIPMPYTVERKIVTETRVPPTYNAEAANQKSMLGSAGIAINALLGLYALKEGAKHFYNRRRGKK